MKKVIDRNLDVPGLVNRPGIKFYDATEPPFRLHGCFVDGEGYYRVPTEVAERTSPNILEMHRYTTGARLRFVTDSPYVAVHIVLREPYTITRMADTGTLGLDVYSDGSFKGILVPPDVMKDDTYESVVNIGEREMHTVTVNLPLYTNVSELYIGLDETSALLEAPDYTYKKPIVYYGSSITNGATASRPGLTYEAIISRRFDIDHLNLGFGGSARGELSMAEYIASLDMSIFVYDYDHNAPTVKHLGSGSQR